LLGLRVYTVFPLTRIVPNFELWVVEIRALVAAIAAAGATEVESPPMARTAPERGTNRILRKAPLALFTCFVSFISLISLLFDWRG
jgi:hypothetical protein